MIQKMVSKPAWIQATSNPRSTPVASSSLAATGKRERLIRTAGLAIITLSVGAALLPLVVGTPRTLAIGGLLVLAGIIELVAGSVRHETRALAILAGAVTTIAGL